MKLGRALGYGTRHAAKTLAAVAEAAASPNPQASSQASRPSPLGSPAVVAPSAAPQAGNARRTRTAPSAARRSANKGLLAPLVTFSSALWLRVTGLFFGLIAWGLGAGAWHLRAAALRPATPAAMHHFWLFVGFAALFSYFAVSGFVRATLRERR